MSCNTTTFTQDVESLAELVNEDKLVTTRYGDNPKKSWLYLQGEFESAIPYTPAGDFATGFTYTSTNQVGLDGIGNYWIYNGSVPFVVAPGTVPSAPDYTQVVFADHNALNNRNAVGAHDDIYIRVFDSVLDATSEVDVDLLIGLTVKIKERAAEFDVVLTSGVNPNGKNIIQSVADPLYSFVLKEGHYSFSDRYGVPTDASGDVSADVKEWLEHCTASGKGAFLAPYRHIINLSIDMPGDINITGIRGKSWLDGTACDAVTDPSYLFGARDGILAVNDKEGIHIERIKFTYPSVEDFAGQTLCGALRFYGGRNSSVRLCDILPSNLNSDINLSATSLDNGLNGSSERVKADNITFSENNILCHSGACVIKGRNPSGEPNDTMTSNVKFINNTVKMTQTSGGSSTTGIIKVDIYSRDIIVSGNSCDGNNLVIGFIQCEEGTENVAIKGNTIIDCNTAGIKLFDGQGAVAFRNIAVTGNTLRNAGIFANHGGAPNPVSEGLVISNNTIDGWQAGGDGALAAISCQFLQLSDTMNISNNTISGSDSGAIFVRAPNVAMNGNVTKGIAGRGISIQDGVDISLDGNVVKSDGIPLVINNCQPVMINGGVLRGEVVNGNGCVLQSGATAGGCVFSGVKFDHLDTNCITTSGVSNGDNLFIGNNFITNATQNRPQDNTLVSNIIATVYTP